jgi:hypothetical protein
MLWSADDLLSRAFRKSAEPEGTSGEHGGLSFTGAYAAAAQT